jgi:hypothetical protein
MKGGSDVDSIDADLTNQLGQVAVGGDRFLGSSTENPANRRSQLYNVLREQHSEKATGLVRFVIDEQSECLGVSPIVRCAESG